MSEQRWNYLKIQNIQTRVLNYSQGRQKDSPTNQLIKQSSASKQDKFSSQERVLKMAEDERELLDEMIAMNQKHKKDQENKKSMKIATLPASQTLSPSRQINARVT